MSGLMRRSIFESSRNVVNTYKSKTFLHPWIGRCEFWNECRRFQPNFILSINNFDRCSIIKIRSGKNHRMTHSAMAAVTCAFAEAFDVAFVLKYSLEELLKRQIQLQMLTDSKQMFAAVSLSTQAKAKRTLIDIAAYCSRLKDTRFRKSDSLLDAICWRTASRKLWSRHS
jgi:hypothetical protein